MEVKTGREEGGDRKSKNLELHFGGWIGWENLCDVLLLQNIKTTIFPASTTYLPLSYIDSKCWVHEIVQISIHNKTSNPMVKGCVPYIFASLFFMSKRELLWNKEKGFLFHFKSPFRFWDNQILIFQIFKCHDVIKCLSMKHETQFIE